MGYYIRFFDTSDNSLDLKAADAALRQIDPAYRVEILPQADALLGDLYYGVGLFGEIEINQRGDDLFNAEVHEQLEALDDVVEDDAVLVAEMLRAAKRSVVVRVLWQDREADDTLVRIEPLWTWLFSTRTGLMQADGEGYYDSQGLILEMK